MSDFKQDSIKEPSRRKQNRPRYKRAQLNISPECTSILAGAYKNCNRIRRVSFPVGLYRIDSQAFQNCTALEEIRLPESIRFLGSGAFSDCTGLHTVSIPRQLAVIQKDTFQNDRRLEQVLFHQDSALTAIRKNAFAECESLESVLLPGRLTSIGDQAFYRCKNLRTVSFPEGLLSIGQKAFYFCALETLTLPQSLEILEESAFFKCNGLKEVCLPAGIKKIGKWVFHGCNRLKVLEIRHDPDFIGEWIINRAARIRCYKGSKADLYCQESGFTVEYL